MNSRMLLRFALPLVVLVGGYFLSEKLAAMKPELQPSAPDVIPPLVRVIEAQPAPVQLSVSTHGTVVPRTQSRVIAEVSGRVLEVSPALVNGGFFEAGDLLLSIDATDYELMLKDFELQVARAERAVAQESADAEQAVRDWERMRGDEEAPALVRREPQLAEARAGLASARAGYEAAMRDVERTRVIAPYPGRVRSEQIDAGEWAQKGQVLAEIYAVDYAEVRLPLPDSELEFLDLPLSYRGEEQTAGPNVTLSAAFAGETHTWTGQIVRTEGELDPASRMIVAVARVADPYGRREEFSRPPLAVGLFVEAHIDGTAVSSAITLPRAAIRGGTEVYILDADDNLERRSVDVLKSERDDIVLKSGVEAGERVIVTPLETVVDGMHVRAIEDVQ